MQITAEKFIIIPHFLIAASMKRVTIVYENTAMM